MPDKSLELATLFTAKVDESFGKIVKTLQKSLGSLDKKLKETAATSKNTVGKFTHIGSELTTLQKALGNSTTETKKFNQALYNLGKGKSELGFAQVKADLVKIEKALIRKSEAIKNTRWAQHFLNIADREAIYNQKILAQKKEIVTRATKTKTAAVSEATRANKVAGNELTNLQKRMGSAENETQNFRKALYNLGKGQSDIGLADVHRELNNIEKSLRRKAKAIKDTRWSQHFLNIVDREAIYNQKILAQRKSTVTKRTRERAAATNKATLETKKAIAEAKKLIAANDKLQKSLSPLKTQTVQTASAWSRLTNAMKTTVSYGIASSAIYGVINALKTGAQEIVKYDQALKNLQAITRATDSEISVMSDVIREVGRTTKFSAVEASEGMVLLGQAGFSATESMSAIQATANLAAGTLTSLATSADLVTTTVRAFNLQAAEAGRVSDVMASAVNTSKLTIEKLRTAFNFVGAAASQAGISLEQTATSMAVLANNGLRASTIGTGLRQVIARLIAPNRKLRDAFIDQGIALDKISPQTVGYEKAVANLTEVLWDAETQSVDMAKAFSLFGLRGAQAAAVLVKAYATGEFANVAKKIGEVGAAAEMAALQKEGLAFQFKNLADKAKDLMIALGDAGVNGALDTLVKSLSSAVDFMAKVVNSTVGTTALKFAGLTSVMLGTVVALKALKGAMISTALWSNASNVVSLFTLQLAMNKTIMQSLIYTMGRLKLVLLALMNTWTFTFVAVAAVVAGAVIAINKFKNANKEAAKEAERASERAKSLAEKVTFYKDALSELEEGSDEYVNTLKRMEKEEPEVARLIAETTGVVDLSTIGYNKLKEAMDKVTSKQFEMSLADADKALKSNQKELLKQEKILKRVQALYAKGRKYGYSALQIGDDSDELARREEAEKKSLDSLRKKFKLISDIGKAEGLSLEKMIELAEFTDVASESEIKLQETFVEGLRERLKLQNEELRRQAEIEKKKIRFIDETIEKKLTAEEQFYNSLGLLEKGKLIKVKQSLAKEEDLLSVSLANRKDKFELYAAGSEEIRSKKMSEFVGVVGKTTDEALKLWDKYVVTRKSQLDDELSSFIKKQADATKEREDALKASNNATDNDERKYQQDKYDKAIAKEIVFGEKIVQLKKEIAIRLSNIVLDESKIPKEKDPASDRAAEKALKKKYKLMDDEAKYKIQKLKEMQKADLLYFESSNDSTRDSYEFRKAQLEDFHARELFYLDDRIKKSEALEGKKSDRVKKLNLQRELMLEKHYTELIGITIEGEDELTEAENDGLEDRIKVIEYEREQRKLSNDELREYIRLLKEKRDLEKKEGKSNPALDTQILDEEARADEDYGYFAKQGFAETINSLEKELDIFDNIKKSVSDLTKTIVNDLTGSIVDFISHTKDAHDAWKDFRMSMLQFAADWLQEQAKMIIKQQILNALTAMMSAMGGGKGAAVAAVAKAHGGGIAGRGIIRTQIVNPNIFANAPRMHDGGVLRKNEVPAILEKGEGVFTQEQMRALGGNKQDIVNFVDPAILDAYLSTPKGKNAILNVIGSRRTQIRNLIGA